MTDIARCGLCGEPMPKGEEMFEYHGYSGPCPKPALPAIDPEPPKHVARPGEKEFAVILRNRSGHDAGCIDFSFPHATALALSPAEQRELIKTAKALAESIEDCCKATAAPEAQGEV